MKSFQAVADNARSMVQSPRTRRWLQVGVVGLALIFFGLAALKLLPELGTYSWQVDPLYLLAAAVIMVGRGPVGAYGWWLIMRQLGYKLPWWRSVRIVYYSNMAGFIPGSMWHAVSRVYLAEQEGVPRLITVISVGFEVVMVLLGSLVVSSFSLLAWHDAPVWVGVALLMGIMALLLQPQTLFKGINLALLKLKRKPLEVQLTARDMLRLLPTFVLNWALYGTLSWALVAALMPDLPLSLLPLLSGIFTVAWQAGYLTPIPQGVGVRELFLVSLLTGLAGIPAPVAAAAALLSRVWSLLGVAVWGAISTRL